MPFKHIALVYDDWIRPDTSGGYCRRALSALARTTHVRPHWRDPIPADCDLVVRIDDGSGEWPRFDRPCAYWAIDTHMDLPSRLAYAEHFDAVFAAQQEGARQLRAGGIVQCEWLPVACDPEVHRQLDLEPTWDVAFVGHANTPHRRRLLEQVQQRFPNSFIGQAPYTEMADIYSRARIVINYSYANDLNMRVFEALSCGSLLITDHLEDNGQEELFQDRVHLVEFRSPEEALELISYYLQHDEERAAIAAAGHQEVIAKHTYRHRMVHLLECIEALTGAEAGRRAATVAPVRGAADSRSRRYYHWPRPDLAALVPEEATRVLDVGCAAGMLGRALKRRQGCQVIGIELNSEAAAEAREHLDRVVEGDVEALDLAEFAPVDAVVCGDVLEHLRAPAEVLAKLRGALARDGVLVASFPNVRHMEVIRNLVEGEWTYEPEGLLDRDHLRFFTRRSAEQLLDDAGFEVMEVRGVPGPGHHGWQQAGRPVQLEAGRLGISRLSPREAEEFFVGQWLMVARPAPRVDWGLTSIVILTWDQLAYTQRCLGSLRKHTHLPYELVVVDNGSRDGTAEWLRMQSDLRLISNPENLGFPRAANQGLRAAAGDNLLLLNNDTVVTPGWLRRLLEHLHSAPEVGAVGPVSNCVSGPQQIATSYQGLAELDGFAWELGRSRRGRSTAAQRLVGFCLLLKRELIEKVGLLDEQFEIGCYEDDDLSLRAVQAGYKLLICEDAFVHHFGGRTFVGSGLAFDQVMQANEKRFREKWGLPEPEAALAPDGEAAPGARKRWRIGRHAAGGLLLEPTPPTISLCMIARDEEPRIGHCLASARPFVDEIVVVDTGSVDRTPEIARSFGAKVVESPWRDSFSEARNASLEQASGEWIFWLDADDVLAEDSGRALRRLVEEADQKTLGFIAQVHCPAGPGESGETVVDHVKLFRNRPDLRFELRIHEQILPSIRRAGGEIVRAPLHIVHANYDHSPAGQERKRERDRRLLALDLAENPDHPFVHFNIGMTALHEKQYPRAVEHLRKSIDLSAPYDSQVRKAYALLAAAHRAVEQGPEARQACEEGLDLYPEDPELLFNKALAHQICGELKEAEQSLLQLLGGHGRGDYLASMDTGIFSYKAEHDLGVVYEQMGEPAKACERWRRVVEQHPDFVPSWLALSQLLLDAARLDEVEALAEQALDVGRESVAALLRGRLAMQRGDPAGAIPALRRAVELAPDLSEGHRFLSHALLQHGESIEAEAVLRRLIELAADDAEAHHNLGGLLLEQGRAAEAVACYETALQLCPQRAGTREMLRQARLQASAPGPRADLLPDGAPPGHSATRGSHCMETP